jgi:hypothetical protein
LKVAKRRANDIGTLQNGGEKGKEEEGSGLDI